MAFSLPAPLPVPELCRADDSGELVYLDHNATTPVHPEVAEVVAAWVRDGWGNPSSGHARGREAKNAVDWAREGVASLLGAPPETVIFTGCGTESNHLALLGAARHRLAQGGGPGRLLYGDLEHPSVLEPLRQLQAEGWSREVLELAQDGRVRVPGRLGSVALATLMLAHNESGALQPVAELTEKLRGQPGSCFIHCDASQAVGKVPVDVTALGVDSLTIAGHKLYAPKGIGALYLREGRVLRPWLAGGGQEGGLRSGTESVPYIVGLGMAARLARRDLEHEVARLSELRERLWGLLQAAVPGCARVTPEGSAALPNTLLLCLPGVSGSELLARCPTVAASTGSACHEVGPQSGGPASGGLLAQMNVPAELRPGVLRLSLGRDSTLPAVERAVSDLAAVHRRLLGGAGA